MNEFFQARARQAAPIEHGGPDLAELRGLGIDPARLIDFSVCTNPFGPSPRVHEAIAHAAVDRYPDPESSALRTALAEKYSLRPEEILVGNGVSELIWLTALAFIRPRARVLVLGPTYGEYARAVRLCGGEVRTCNAQARDYFAPSSEEIECQLAQAGVVFLCNPNNPTGAVCAPEVVVSWARRHPQTLFVVDEAYQAFVPDLSSLVGARVENLLVLRSMTKDYALTGLRIGYAVGSASVVKGLADVRPPWSVNAVAQAAAEAALGDERHLIESLAKLEAAKEVFVQRLRNLGMDVFPSAAHFFLVRVGNGPCFREKLLKRGILVRNAASFGLPDFVRLATRRPEHNALFCARVYNEQAPHNQ